MVEPVVVPIPNQPPEMPISHEISFPPVLVEADPPDDVVPVTNSSDSPLHKHLMATPHSEYPLLLPIKIQDDFCISAKSKHIFAGPPISRVNIFRSLRSFYDNLNIDKGRIVQPTLPSESFLALSLDLVSVPDALQPEFE